MITLTNNNGKHIYKSYRTAKLQLSTTEKQIDHAGAGLEIKWLSIANVINRFDFMVFKKVIKLSKNMMLVTLVLYTR